MKFKRSILAAITVAALASGMPTGASAQGTVTLSFGSGYETPYSGYDSYPGYSSSGYDDGSYYDSGDDDGGYSEDVYIVRPDYGHRDERYAREGYRNGQRCSSGTTGAILGAVVGGLLGGEVGRGGYYNERSTTGAIIGAGGGALAGRAIERSGCR